MSTFGCESSPAKAGTTRISAPRPISMNSRRLSATVPVPAGGIRGLLAMTVPTCASRACASRSSLSSK